MTIKQKFERIDQSKLEPNQVNALKIVVDFTENFKTKDAEKIRVTNEKLDNIIEKLQAKNPDALKPAKMPTAKKTSQTSKPKRTVLGVAKEIRKSGESFDDAKARATKIINEEKEATNKVVKSEMKSLLEFIKKHKELEGIHGTDLGRDASRVAKRGGVRTVTHSGSTTNQYGTFENKLGRKYSENRENRKDRLAPNYPKDAPLLKKGGMLSSKERYALEIKGQTGLSVGAIEKYIDDNNLSDNDVLNIVVGLGRRQLKGADVATAVAGKKGNTESKKLIAFMKDDKAMKMELGGNVGAYDLAGHLDGTLNVGQNNGNLDGFSGTHYTGLVGETGAMSSGEMFELGGNVGAYDLAGHLNGTLNVGQNNGDLSGFSGTHYTGLVGETGAMSSGEMFENGGGLDGAMQSYTNAYAHEGTGMYYENGGAIKGDLNKQVNTLALKEKFTTDSLGRLEYRNIMIQALVESLTDANFHQEAKEVVMKAEGEKTWTKELYKSEYFNADKKVAEFARSVARICDYDGDDIVNAYYFTTKMQGSKVATMIENLFLNKSKSSSKKGFVANVEFNTGDVVWDKEEKRYGVVMNNYGDAVNGEGGEIRLDSTGNTEIFEYNSDYDRTGYKLVKHGSKEDAGNGDVQDIKDSANRLIASQIKSKDKENEKYYREIFKRVLDGEFDKKSTSGSKKYVPHYDIESITVKKGNKQTKFKGSDVLNGANMLKKGGDLSKSATYFPKRDIVSVKLKSGEVIHPANGYWVGKTPKMVRTQFEESAFEYEEGGFTNKDGIKVRSVAKPEKELTEKEWMEKHSESKEARAYEDGGELESAIKGYKEYTKKLWEGKGYFSEEKVKGELSDLELDLRRLNDGRVKPSKIVGTGYKNPKKVAQEWLAEQIDYRKSQIESKGLSDRINQSNFAHYVREAKSKNMISEQKAQELLDERDSLVKPFKMNEGGKVTFKDKAKAIAKNFEGKRVEPKYQKEYGKTYDKVEAKEVGNKIAGSQKAMYDSKMSTGGAVKKRTGSPKMKEAHVIAKRIRKEGESWSSALKRAWAELK